MPNLTNTDALIATLGEGSPEENQAVSQALVKIGPAAVQALIAAAHDDRKASRKKLDAIADVLGDIGTVVIPDLIPVLLVGYKYGAFDLPQVASRALGRIGVPAMPALIDAMNAGSMAVAEAFGSIGAFAAPTLIAALSDPSEAIRFTAAEGLSRIGPDAKDAPPGLIAALDDESPRVRCSAAWALGRFVSPPANGALAALIATLGDEDKDVRLNAVCALANIGPDAAPAVPALLRSLCDLDHKIRWRTVMALGHIGTPAPREAVTAIIATLSDQSVDLQRGMFHGDCLRRVAVSTLTGIGVAGMPDLIAALREQRGDVRWVVARVLGRIGPAASDAVPALIDALADTSPFIRSEVVESLGKIGSPAAVPALIAAVSDETETVRSLAAGALGKIGPWASDATPALRAVLNDLGEDDGVRLAAQVALRHVAPAIQ